MQFSLDMRLLSGYPSSSTVLLKGGSVQLLEHAAAQSANNHSTTWQKNHTIVSHDHMSLDSDESVQEIATKGLDIATLLRDPTIPIHFLPGFECQYAACLWNHDRSSLRVWHAISRFDIRYWANNTAAHGSSWLCSCQGRA